ncbi:MAG: hypothetical protein WBP45_03040 [Daejeonella sp.]
MKTLRVILVFILFVLISFTSVNVYSQCAMCNLTAENSVKNGNTQGKGLNSGILYLLAAPYLAVAVIGFIWYKKYRCKNVDINMKDEKINLN